MEACVASAVIVACVLAACSDEAVVLATIPASPDDGGERPGRTRCVRTADCPGGMFCDDKPDCSDDTTGVCEPYPGPCGNEQHLVCGCDGVTYFNDCWRRTAGVPHARLDECGPDAFVCGGLTKDPCPGTAVCAKLLGFGGTCSDDAKGTCWVLPLSCPPPTSADRWNACGPSGEACVDTCNALRSGKPYFHASHCG
jgi:hypothetical protein